MAKAEAALPPVRSPVRWAGSKAKLVPSLSNYWRRSESLRYLEAFCGSAAFFFNVRPNVALLNDTNPDLIAALSVLKKHPRLLHDELTGMRSSADRFYELRSQDPVLMDPVDRAIRFFYLNRYCFNGIYRTNRSGRFNVPYGGERTGGFPPLEDWLRASSQLQGAVLSGDDFETFVLNNVRSEDFVYLDPPYAVSNRRVFSQYSANSFGLSDMERLAGLLLEIDRRGAKFVVSYAQSPEARILAGHWVIRREYAQRHIAGFAGNRRKALEVFISNFEP